MKTTSTILTLTLIAALLLAGNTRTSAQEVAEAASTPALLLSFTGTAQGTTADLNWTMENETNCKWFVIERSGDSGGFDSIDVVMGMNNNNETDYSFTDAHMLQGNNYYRLRQVDRDGIVRYSKVVTLYDIQNSGKMEVFPNPAVATLNFSVTSPAMQPVLVQIYSLTGVMMMSAQQELAAGNNQQTLAINNLRTGNYILKVSSLNGASQYVQSFVKM